MDPVDIVIRPLRTDDSVEELTELLRRGYKILADMGLRYLATHQDADITRQRIENAECFVAEYKGKIIATITFNMPDKTDGAPWYDRPEVAHFQQFAVEPKFQRHGIGTRIMKFIEDYARKKGVIELALDTSEKATHLIDWYKKLGYRFIGYADWDETNYRSVIMSKTLQ
jgi:GNAT superfamily N-acetyltransferase